MPDKRFCALALTTVTGNFNSDAFTDVAVLTQDNIATMLNLNYTVGIGDEDPEPAEIPQKFTLE